MNVLMAPPFLAAEDPCTPSFRTRHLSRKVFNSQPSCGGCQHILSNPVIGIPSNREGHLHKTTCLQ